MPNLNETLSETVKEVKSDTDGFFKKYSVKIVEGLIAVILLAAVYYVAHNSFQIKPEQPISEISADSVITTTIPESGQIVFLDKRTYKTKQVLSKELSMKVFALKSLSMKQDYAETVAPKETVKKK
jgi:hypothetical protein